MSSCGASASWRKKILSPGIVGEAGRVAAAGEHVEAVQAQAERGVVGPADDVATTCSQVDDVPAPGQRLVGDPEPALAGARRRARRSCSASQVVVVDRVRRDRGADQDGVGAQLPPSRRTCARPGAGCAAKRVGVGTSSRSRNGW